MSNLFAGVYGARFPEVVMNSGPLPPEGGLPAPLHDTPDARINYGSTLLGDLQPYAYGEAGYMSSQSQNNQPHRIQKIIPELHLPEPSGLDTFRLSHAVDDSDLAFVMRLNRNSVFCTGTRGGTRRNTKIGTTVDPIINLATLNYLLAGLQLSLPDRVDENNLWWEFLFNLDPTYWNKNRDYSAQEQSYAYNISKDFPREICGLFGDKLEYFEYLHDPFILEDIMHVIRHCIKPFGIVRGSEKQGGQHEMSNSPAVWTAPTIATMVIDGKEANVVNIWHFHDLNAGDDLVLRLKPMPVKTYTLNHYFKGFARKSFEAPKRSHVWQLVPDVFDMNPGFFAHTTKETDILLRHLAGPANDGRMLMVKSFFERRLQSHLRDSEGDITTSGPTFEAVVKTDAYQHYRGLCWQQLGFWHIGRTQVMRPKYGSSEFYNDDMANGLKTNHIDMTFQPIFSCHPRVHVLSGLAGAPYHEISYSKVGQDAVEPSDVWAPTLQIERFHPSSYSWDVQGKPPAVPRQVQSDRASFRFTGHGILGSLHRDEEAFSTESWEGSSRVSFPVLEDRPAKRMALHPRQSSIPASNLPSEPFPLLSEIARLPSDYQEVEPSLALDPPAPAAVEAPMDAAVHAPCASTAVDPPPAAAGSEPMLSDESRKELLGGLDAPPKKNGRGAGKKRGPVEGTLLRPGADPEPCRMELL